VRGELNHLVSVVGHEELALLKALLITVSGRLG